MSTLALSPPWRLSLQWSANVLAGLVLAASFGLVLAEERWKAAALPSPRESFLHGSTGTEIMPLPVFQVLFDVVPEHFQPGGPEQGNWMQQFGFIPDDDDKDGVPYGFSVSTHRPRTGAPTPTPFVGITCSLCHSAKLKRGPDDPGVVLHGMGTTSLDFIGWVDAFKSAVLDPRLTPDAIAEAHEKRGHALGLVDKLLVRVWLSDTRDTLRENMPKSDRPYDGADLRLAALLPNGPSRTQPFRNLVRNVMNLPAMTDRAYCKIPALYQQGDRSWGQYDGSVRDKLTRSVLAAIAVGATQHNLPLPDIAHNVQEAIAYTTTLAAPRFADVFPADHAALDKEAIARGAALYATHCDSCHGHPENGRWQRGKRQDQLTPLAEIGTDPERVTFRFYAELPDELVKAFPAKHPLRPKRENLRPGPAGTTRGYLNTPIHGAFAHAPYLHNGSVLTLAELINLKPRRTRFYRGDNLYDPDDAGLISPEARDARHYFELDTQKPGNSAAGHDYPWRYRGPGWDEAALQDLLSYLKTL